MSRLYSLGEQQELFDVPHPIDPSSGRTWSASVHTFSYGQRRKRAEVVIATDGESINIYNIKNPKLLASYPLPTQAYLQATPCCLFLKASKNKPASRIVYAAIRDELDPSEHTLQSFKDDASSSLDETYTSQAVPERFNCTLGNDADPVAYVETIPNSTTGDRDVLCVQKSGQVTVISADLQTTKWTAHAGDLVDPHNFGFTSRTNSVKFASMCDVASAARGFLRFHPDVLANIAPVDQADAHQNRNVQILVLVTQLVSSSNTSQLRLSVYSIKPSQSIPTSRSAFQHLMSWDFPGAKLSSSDSASQIEYFFDFKLGTLQQLVENELLVYSFTESASRRLASVEQSHHGTTSLLPISGFLSLVSSTTGVSLVDVRFNSTHASRTFNATMGTSQSRKRKRNYESQAPVPIRLIQYLPRTGTVLGLLQSKIICFQLRLPKPGHRSATSKSESLMRSIGQSHDTEKGSRKDAGLSQNKQDARLSSTIKEMKSHAEKRNVEAYEKCFYELVYGSKSLDAGHLHSLAICSVRHIFNGVLQFFTTQTGNRATFNGSRKAFIPRKVFQWLAGHGYISPRFVESALNSNSASKYDQALSVSSQNLIDVISTCDPTLVLLSDVLNESSQLGLAGIVQALSCILQSFESLNPIREDRLLVSGPKANGIGDDEFFLEEEEARIELELATELLEDGIRPRALALKKGLDSLSASYSPSEIALSLRLHMKQQQLMLLVELLRFELSGGGWTSKILDFAPDADVNTSQDGAIHSICVLLNCSMDALGAGGWLLGMNGSVDMDKSEALVTFLRNETGAVLEGVQESTFIQAFLKDFLRYGDLIGTLSNKRRRFNPLLGADSALPIGRRAAHEIPDTKVGAGGEIQMRSSRDISKKLSQRLGKYTLERLDI